MRNLTLISALALTALGGCAMTPGERAAAADRATTADGEMRRALAGLSPAETSDCLPPRPQASLSAYGAKLVYRVSNRLAYVSDTGGGCEGVAHGDVLVTKSSMDRVCRGDIATTLDQGSRAPTGSCGLGAFTAWRQ